MNGIKKILIFLIIIILLEGLSIITLHYRIWVNTNLIIGLNNGDVVASKLIYSLQRQMLQK